MPALPLNLRADQSTWNALLLALRTSGDAHLRTICGAVKVSSAERADGTVAFALSERNARTVLSDLTPAPATRTVLAEISRQLAQRDQDAARAKAWAEHERSFVSSVGA